MEEPLFVSFAGDEERQYPVREEDIAFVYRPIWDCARQVVLTYLCQPAPSVSMGAGAEARSLCVARCSEMDRCRLDVAVLRAVLAHAGELQRAGKRLLIACPIHFGSIAVAKSWASYAQVLNAAPKEALRDVAF